MAPRTPEGAGRTAARAAGVTGLPAAALGAWLGPRVGLDPLAAGAFALAVLGGLSALCAALGKVGRDLVAEGDAGALWRLAATLFALPLLLLLPGCATHMQLGGAQLGTSVGPAENWEAGPASEAWTPVLAAIAARITEAKGDAAAARLAESLTDPDGCPLGAGKVWIERSGSETTKGQSQGQAGQTSADSRATTAREEKIPLAAICGPAAYAKSGSASGGAWAAVGNGIWAAAGILLAHFSGIF